MDCLAAAAAASIKSQRISENFFSIALTRLEDCDDLGQATCRTGISRCSRQALIRPLYNTVTNDSGAIVEAEPVARLISVSQCLLVRGQVCHACSPRICSWLCRRLSLSLPLTHSLTYKAYLSLSRCWRTACCVALLYLYRCHPSSLQLIAIATANANFYRRQSRGDRGSVTFGVRVVVPLSLSSLPSGDQSFVRTSGVWHFRLAQVLRPNMPKVNAILFPALLSFLHDFALQ